MSMELQEQCAKLMPEAPGGNSRGCLFVCYFPRDVDDGEPGAVRPRLPDQRHGVPAARSRVLHLAAVTHGRCQEGRDHRASRCSRV